MPVDSDRGAVMDDERLYAWSNPWFRWSVVVARRRSRSLSFLVGFVVLPSVQRRFHRGRASGPASAARRACPRNWGAGAAADEGGAGVHRASCSCRAMARAGLERRRRARRDARAPAVQHVPRRARHERGRRAQPRGAISRGRASSSCRTTRAATAIASFMHGARRATSPTATSPTSPPTTTRCRRRARRPRDTTRARRPRWCASATRCATSRLASHVTAVPTTSSARRGSRACPRSTSSFSSTTSRSGTRRNDSHAQMRNMARAMTAREIDEVADFYAQAAEGRGRLGLLRATYGELFVRVTGRRSLSSERSHWPLSTGGLLPHLTR